MQFRPLTQIHSKIEASWVTQVIYLSYFGPKWDYLFTFDLVVFKITASPPSNTTYNLDRSEITLSACVNYICR